jgi:hypothetical protein
MANHDFSGTWHNSYQYLSTSLPGVFNNEHDVKITQKGDRLIIESQPNGEKSYLIANLKLDGRVATGTWEQHSSPTGRYKGEIYTGGVQLVLNEDGNFYGMHVYHDRREEVRSGYWEIRRKK